MASKLLLLMYIPICSTTLYDKHKTLISTANMNSNLINCYNSIVETYFINSAILVLFQEMLHTNGSFFKMGNSTIPVITFKSKSITKTNLITDQLKMIIRSESSTVSYLVFLQNSSDVLSVMKKVSLMRYRNHPSKCIFVLVDWDNFEIQDIRKKIKTDVKRKSD